MTNDDRIRPQFDDRDAEAELERIRRELEAIRQRRKDAGEAFDVFLRSFGPRSAREPRPIDPRPAESRAVSRSSDPRPVGTPVSEPRPIGASEPRVKLGHSEIKPDDPAIRTASSVTPASPAPEPPRAAPAPPESRSDQTSAPESLDSWMPEPTTPLAPFDVAGVLNALKPESRTILETPSPEPRTPEPVVPAAPALPWNLRLGRPHAAAAVLILAGAAALVIWQLRGPASNNAADSGRPATVAAPRPAAQDTAVGPAAPVTPTGFQVELSTLRPVWVRVVVDGERRIEREIPADQQIPLTAKETVVIRAGDAGALHVTIAGKQQGPLGQDGFPATKTFTRPR